MELQYYYLIIHLADLFISLVEVRRVCFGMELGRTTLQALYTMPPDRLSGEEDG